MSKHTLKKEDLGQFTGTERWFKHSIVPGVTYTEGARHVAQAGGAYWLLDEIALAQMGEPAVKDEPFQHWCLKVDLEKSTAVLTCDDGNDNIVFTKEIPFTDFPIDEVRFYFTDGVILLPSEY